ncbi:MAG: peptide ABC transporter substrate-binding protein [Patescibacteria group bacterium]|nr:peptide ABC transporter substrate-binding protein [Patescibacteria group bacterium]MDD5490987.1 peptide ABC transporter substrate-binding protein [Patescibacteria group bacterium]
MKFQDFFRRSKNDEVQKNNNPRPFVKQADLDKKLVLSLSKSRIPSFKQLKHLPKFLGPTENLLIKIVLATAVLALGILGWMTYKERVTYSPSYGGEYTEGLVGTPRYLNPVLAQTSEVDRDLSRLIFSSLLQYNENQEIVLDLAEKWEITADQKVYTVYLKQNVLWHDGAPFTADDVIFTVESIKDPEYRSPLAPSFRGVTVSKIDDYKISFSLEEPYAPFIEILTFGILPRHIWGEIPPANIHLAEYNLKPIGSGPFRFESLTKDRLGNIKSYRLSRNENYYLGRPFIEKINFKFYPDFNSAVEALRNKNTEGVNFLPRELKSVVEKNKGLVYYSLQIPQYTALFFNQSKKDVLKDKNLRKALALSLDRQKILEEILGGEGVVIDGPILPGYLGYTNETEKYDLNLSEANKILDELKWEILPIEDYINNRLAEELKKLEEEKAKQPTSTPPAAAAGENNLPAVENNPETKDPAEIISEKINNEIDKGQNFFRKKSGEILALNLTTVNQAENVKAAELIKNYWQEIGIKVNLIIVPPADIRRETIKNRDYEILLYSEIVGSDPDPYPFWHSSQNSHPGLNLAIFVNRHIDELLEDARQTINTEERSKKYKEFQDIMSKELPAIFLYSPTYTYVMDKKIKGIVANRLTIPSDRFAKIEKWYIKTKKNLNF